MESENEEYFNRSVMTGTHLMEGNIALAEGCIAGGCRVFAGYPITPQSDIPERMAKRLPEVGGVFLQMEDEIASISAAVGATITGAKAMTSTSGPGFSLMQETLSWAALIEMPVVIVNVQRVGPGTGVVSLPTQGDLTQIKRGGNGEYEVICFAPNSCQELFDLSIEAFNMAQQYRVPTYILSDAWLGHMREKVVIPSPEEIRKRVKPKPKFVRDPKASVGRPGIYTTANKEMTEFDIPPFPNLGSIDFPFWWISLTHSQESGMITELPPIADRTNKIISYKISRNEAKISMTEKFLLDDKPDVVIIAYGLPSRSAKEAIKTLRAEGVKVGMLRLITVHPTPETAIKEVCTWAKHIVIPEMNLGQMAEQVERFAYRDNFRIPVHRLSITTRIHTPEEIVMKVKKVLLPAPTQENPEGSA
jgi:2-oxoglutarate ferredoxin oxidoreductase subunit alpha